MQLNLSPETTCLDRPHYCGQWGGLSRQVLLYYYKYISFSLLPKATFLWTPPLLPNSCPCRWGPQVLYGAWKVIYLDTCLYAVWLEANAHVNILIQVTGCCQPSILYCSSPSTSVLNMVQHNLSWKSAQWAIKCGLLRQVTMSFTAVQWHISPSAMVFGLYLWNLWSLKTDGPSWQCYIVVLPF